MIYLKEYNNFNFYEEIDESEHFLAIRGFGITEFGNSKNAAKYIENNWISFTKQEIDLLNEYVSLSISTISEEFVTKTINFLNFSIPNFNNSEIIKIKDEWFYVELTGVNVYRKKFYKCDQFEGLIELLKFLTNK